jgi:ligand-binding sensor domain-containing protein
MVRTELRRYGAVVFIVCALWTSVNAQSDTLNFYPIRNASLQQFVIRKASTTKDGKLWLATDKGIVSFDGNDTRVFNHIDGDVNTLRGSSISRFFQDNKGNFFVVIVGTGVDYLDTRTGKASRVNIQIASKDSSRLPFPTPYSDIFIDKDQTIWAGLYNYGLVHYDLRTQKTVSFFLHPGFTSDRNSVYFIQPDLQNENALWLGTDDGIYSFNKKTQELTRRFRSEVTADSSALDIDLRKMQTEKDYIWFAVDRKGMGRYSIKEGTYEILPIENWQNNPIYINHIQRKSQNEFYIGHSNGLPGVFNSQTHKYSFASRTANDIPIKNVNLFLIDSAGNYWAAIWDQLYVAHSNKNKFETIQIVNTIYPGRIWSAFKNIIWDPAKKNYYAGYDNGDGIFVLDSLFKIKSKITEEILDAQYPTTRMLDIGLDNRQHLWLSNINLSTFDSRSGKMLLSEKVFPQLKFRDERFQNIVFRNNYIFLQPSLLPYHALYRINTSTYTMDSIPYPSEMIDNKSYDDKGKALDLVEIDKSSTYAYAGYHNTLFQYNLNSRQLKKVVTIPNITKPWQHFFNNPMYKLDDNDHLWVATNQVIYIYEPTQLRLIDSIRQEDDSYVLQLCNVEGAGMMCVLYSGGVKIYDYARHRQFHLDRRDGLVTNTLNTSIACVNRVLFVGSFDFLQYLGLDKILANSTSRKCYLSSISIFDQPLKTDTIPEFLRVLKLSHKQNFIKLSFSSAEFEIPENIEYRYRLSSINKNWVYTNYLNRTISYNNLSPGHYTFYTSIKNKDGSWTDNPAPLQLTIKPAWWQTTLFSVFLFLSLLLLAFAMIRWRIKTVRRQEQRRSLHEKELLELEAKALRAQMNPHFVFNCLNSIKSLIQEHQEEKAITYLTTFSKLIRTLFNNADKKEISLFDEIETCKLYLQLESMRFDAKFSYKVTIDETIDLKSVQIPALIIQPFIENAIWHGIVPKGNGGKVELAVRMIGNNVQISIEDDGIGREASTQNKSISTKAHQSKGINLTQSRLELDNLLRQRQARLETIDKKDENESTGTKVIITISEELS